MFGGGWMIANGGSAGSARRAGAVRGEDVGRQPALVDRALDVPRRVGLRRAPSIVILGNRNARSSSGRTGRGTTCWFGVRGPAALIARTAAPSALSARYRAPAGTARERRSRRCTRAARTVPRSLRGRPDATPLGRRREGGSVARASASGPPDPTASAVPGRPIDRGRAVGARALASTTSAPPGPRTTRPTGHRTAEPSSRVEVGRSRRSVDPASRPRSRRSRSSDRERRAIGATHGPGRRPRPRRSVPQRPAAQPLHDALGTEADGGASPVHGIGTRQPSRPRSLMAGRPRPGSCEQVVGQVLDLGQAESSPWSTSDARQRRSSGRRPAPGARRGRDRPGADHAAPGRVGTPNRVR